MPLEIRRHDDFHAVQSAWQTLEQIAGCSLFTSWQWQQAWWQTWGDKLELQLYSFRTSDGTVVGIAPLFMRRYRFKRLLTLRQLQPIGNIYPSDETVLSEYLDLVVDPAFTADVQAAFLILLQRLSWDELALPLITTASNYYRAISGHKRFAVKEMHEGAGVCVSTSGTFADYLAGLGKNTRLKLFNRRKLLEQMGTVTVSYAQTREEAISCLEQLNQLASARWGRPHFGARSMLFHCQLAQSGVDSGTLRLSRLCVNDATISLLYNLRLGSTEFNLQASFEENFHPKISPGTLHLGYAIEQAFDDHAIVKFDLLFGSGKNAFYKRHFNGETTEFVTLLVAGSPTARLLAFAKEVYGKLRPSPAPLQETEKPSDDNEA